eukprot:6433752-Lingulodinium_polyedra.AAC.1
MKRRQGGIRQRAANRSDGGTQPDGEHSVLAEFLIEQWAWGAMSATDVQKIALLAQKDGAQGAELQRLASLGNHGKSKNHCHGQLVQRVEAPFLKNALSPIALWYSSGTGVQR